MLLTILVSLSRNDYGTSVPMSQPKSKTILSLNPLESLVMTTVNSDDSVVGSRYMVSTMLIWIVQQDSGKSLSFFLLLRSTCFTADRQPTNSAARWRHPRYFYTVARKLRRCSSSRQPVAASALAFGLYEAVTAMRRRRNRAPLCRRPRWRPRPRAT